MSCCQHKFSISLCIIVTPVVLWLPRVHNNDVAMRRFRSTPYDKCAIICELCQFLNLNLLPFRVDSQILDQIISRQVRLIRDVLPDHMPNCMAT